MDGNKILVIGAGGALGREIVRHLGESGADITATYRTPRPAIEQELSSMGANATRLDLADKDKVKYLLGNANAVIFTPILSIAGKAAGLLRDDQRAVFISSNNVAIDPDADDYARLLKAEADITAASPKAIILRPTMIYGYPGDGNLSSLVKTMRRFPVTPLPGSGKALQQPVYYQALARAAVAALFAAADHPRLCAVAGPEPVTLRELYQAVARAAKARTLIAPLPVRALSRAISLIERSGIKLPVSSAQLARVGLDKTPKAQHVILTDTGLEAGLKALVAAMTGLDGPPGGRLARSQLRSSPTMSETTAHTDIKAKIDAAPVMLFMKGTPQFPQCGFSSTVVQILDHLGVTYDTANVLETDALRQGIKEFSDWPTVPQLYVKGEFVGGCDIVREMFEKGELRSLLQTKGIEVAA